MARLTIIVCLAMVVGCDLPRDPENTLNRVRGDILKIGTTSATGLSDARERAVLNAFAEKVGAEIRLHHEELHALVKQIERGEIHLIAGRLPKNTPFSKHLGLSAPVSKLRRKNKIVDTVFGVRPGENAFLYELDKTIRQRQ